MVTDAEYEQIHEQAWKDSEEYLNKNGYFFSDTYTDEDLINLEKLIWDAARDYVRGNLSSSAFNVICSDYQGNPVYYSLSDHAVSLISNGLELDYYMFVNPDQKKLIEIENNIKKLVIYYFGNL